jgi:hypothetical protein
MEDGWQYRRGRPLHLTSKEDPDLSLNRVVQHQSVQDLTGNEAFHSVDEATGERCVAPKRLLKEVHLQAREKKSGIRAMQSYMRVIFCSVQTLATPGEYKNKGSAERQG